jgi:hypothetical protein
MASNLRGIKVNFPTQPKEVPEFESDVEMGVGQVEISSILVVDKQLEKKLLRKFDLHILPLLAVMYLFK